MKHVQLITHQRTRPPKAESLLAKQQQIALLGDVIALASGAVAMLEQIRALAKDPAQQDA